jgi:hypothetical protein
VSQRDGAVESYDGGVGPRKQAVVEQQDLGPARLLPAGRLGVACRDRGFDRVRARPAHGERAGRERRRCADCLVVPARAVLVAEQHDVACGGKSRGRAGEVQPDERQQAEYLGFARHELGEQPGQPLRVASQLGALWPRPARREVAFVEEQVDDDQDLVQAGR